MYISFVMNEIGTCVNYAPVVNVLNEIFGRNKNHNEYSGQISYDCPVCSFDIKGLDHLDGKGNLEINYKIGVYKCWSCGETHNTKGFLRYLIKKHGNSRQLKQFDLFSPEYDGTIEKKHYDIIKLPKEYISFTNCSNGIKLTHHYRRAMNYLKSRNITDDIIKANHIGFCYEGEYQNRIIIPSYDEEFNLNYFIARSYEKWTKMKYKNPKAEKEIIIWNEHLIDWKNRIYLVEGVFDSIFLQNSIPMLGKVISEHLLSKLYENAKEIVIVLDGDAYNDAEKLYEKLNCGKLFNKIWLIKLPFDKDIADLKGMIKDYKMFQLI